MSDSFAPAESELNWQDGVPVVDYDSTFEKWDTEDVAYDRFLGNMDIMTARISGMLCSFSYHNTIISSALSLWE